MRFDVSSVYSTEKIPYIQENPRNLEIKKLETLCKQVEMWLITYVRNCIEKLAIIQENANTADEFKL